MNVHWEVCAEILILIDRLHLQVTVTFAKHEQSQCMGGLNLLCHHGEIGFLEKQISLNFQV